MTATTVDSASCEVGEVIGLCVQKDPQPLTSTSNYALLMMQL